MSEESKMTKSQIEEKFNDRLSQILRECWAELSNNGIAVGRIVRDRYNDAEYRVTRLTPKIYNHGNEGSFHVEIQGVKRLSSGEFGTHEHSVLLD